MLVVSSNPEAPLATVFLLFVSHQQKLVCTSQSTMLYLNAASGVCAFMQGGSSVKSEGLLLMQV